MQLTDLLNELTSQDGSDLHLVVGQPPVFRIHGNLVRRANTPPLDEAAMETLLTPHLTEGQQFTLREQGQDVEKTVRLDPCRFRLHVFHERGSLAACLRVVPTRVPTLDELGQGADDYPVFQDIIRRPRGLVLVVGPTGSGKSTTVAALIEEINRTRAERIVTIEDPVEYVFESKESIITQRTVGEDIPNFPMGLRSAFREDLDVLLIGETRDLETMMMSLTMAETGHLVFSTLHVNNASAAVQRLIDAFPEGHQPVIRRMVAQNLVAVIAQKLLPRADRPGRVAANEVMIASPRVRQMIMEGQKDLTVAIEAGRDAGMQTMDDSLVQLYERGIISFETAWMHLEDKDRIKRDAASLSTPSAIVG